MNKEQRKYYDQGYRAGKKGAFDKGWQSAHDEFEDHLKKEHYDKGFAAGAESMNPGRIREEAYAKGCDDTRAECVKLRERSYEEGLAKGKLIGFEEGEAKTWQPAKAEGYELAKKDMREHYKQELVNEYNRGVSDNSKKTKALIDKQQLAWNCKETRLNRKIKGLYIFIVALVVSGSIIAGLLF